MPQRHRKTPTEAAYEALIEEAIKTLERLSSVKAPAVEYLAALHAAWGRIEDWICASIAAAEEDVRRQRGD